MPGNKWDDARNFEMAMMFAFLEVAKQGDGKLDHAAVAAKLGDGFTEAGVRQKFYKLKKEAEKLIDANGDGAASANPGTPATTKTTAKTPKSTGKRTKATAVADDAAADDDAAAATPTKKARTKKTTAAAKVKAEPEAEEGVKSDPDTAGNGGEANGNANGEAEVEAANGAEEKAA